MKAHIQIHHDKEVPTRLATFMPLNGMALVFEVGGPYGGRLNQYDLPAEKAWAMFDIWADPDTRVYDTRFGDGTMFRMSDADAPARLAKLRAETIGQPVPESEAA